MTGPRPAGRRRWRCSRTGPARRTRGFALDGQTGPAVARLVARLDGMPLAIELAAARVEALGVGQLLDRLDDRFALLTAGTGWHRRGTGRWRRRWSGATSCSMSGSGGCSGGCRCSRGRSRWRPPRRSPGRAPGRRCCTWWTARCWCRRGPGPMAGPGTDAGDAARLRGRAAGRGRGGARAAAALAGYALEVAEQAAAGLQTSDGGGWPPPGGWTPRTPPMQQALAWALEHDPAAALRLAVALALVVVPAGPAAGQYPLLREAAGRAEPGSDGWCAAQFWLGYAAQWTADLAGALSHLHRGPGRGRRPGAVPGAGRCPGRPVGGTGQWAGSPRRPRMPAAPWPWPGSWATRLGRCSLSAT